uniref:Calcium-binding protein n=1 Tax=Streptomyces sp. NBC_00049 TaxID=2903617 RepID=A0AAU2K121_9ACTN
MTEGGATVAGDGGSDTMVTGDVAAGSVVGWGDGNDSLTTLTVGAQALAGTATVDGGTGDDTIRTGEIGAVEPSSIAQAQVNGGDGNDTIEAPLLGMLHIGKINGGPGNDHISGVLGTLLVVGSQGTVNGNAGTNTCTVLNLLGGTVNC